jgi:hypothetical protein
VDVDDDSTHLCGEKRAKSVHYLSFGSKKSDCVNLEDPAAAMSFGCAELETFRSEYMPSKFKQ